MKLDRETRLNRFGSGIFMMRHMEIFNGRKKDFNSGIRKESLAQNNQLTSLRKRYIVKMLMTFINEKRDQIEKESQKYSSFNDS